MTTRQPKRARRRSFGAVRQLPSGRWQASYPGPDGQRHAASTTFDTKLDADRWLARQQIAVRDPDWTPPARPDQQPATVDDFAPYATAWVRDRDLRPRTRQHYEWILDSRILPTFAKSRLRDITPAAVRRWHANLADSGTTARAHAYALLRSILSTAVDDDAIPSNPARIAGASKTNVIHEVRPASLDELREVRDAMPDRLRLLVDLAAWCALRFGEVTELRRADVDLANGVLHVRRAVTRPHGRVEVGAPKTKAGTRDVSIPPHLLPAVRRHLLDHAQIGDQGLLFYAVKTGAQLAHSSLLWHFNRAAEAAGRPDLTPHALRHTGAVLAAQSGATIAELMARLGHTTPQMALRYQHASAERDAVIAARLSDLAGDA